MTLAAGYLLNTVTTAVAGQNQIYRAAALLSDATVLSAVENAGGITVPATTKMVAAALLGAKLRQAGQDEAVIQAVMLSAAMGVLFQAQGLDASAMLVKDWYYDPINGSDLNDGRLLLAPTKTFARIASQWGFGVLNPGAGTTVTVHVLTAPATAAAAAADPIAFNLAGLGPSVNLLFVGTVTAVANSADTIAAVTVKNRATNTPWAITPTTLASWAAYVPGGATPSRVHDITNDSIFWPVKNVGAGVGRMSEPIKVQTPSAASGTGVSANYAALSNSSRPAAAIQVGDSFVLESLPQVIIGQCNIAGADPGGPALSGTPNNVAFQDLFILRANTNARVFVGTDGFIAMKFYQCFVDETLMASPATQDVSLINCAYRRNIAGSSGLFLMHAGVLTGQCVFSNVFLFLDVDVILQGVGVGMLGSTAKLGTLGVFDAVGGPNNPSGSGCHVMGGSSAINLTFSDSTHQVWGSGNAGAGVSVAGGGTFNYNTVAPSVTGSTPATNDFTVGGSSTLFPFNPATMLPAAGALACSWANLAAAYAGGTGFGGGAINVLNGGAISKGTA